MTRRVIDVGHAAPHDGFMDHLTRLIDTHLAGYAEPDADQRRRLLEQVWAADGRLTDPPFEATGPTGVAELTEVLLQHYPGHRFRRTSAVDAHHDVARYTWELVDPDGAVAVAGLDVVTVADGRLTNVVGFFGDVPAA